MILATLVIAPAIAALPEIVVTGVSSVICVDVIDPLADMLTLPLGELIVIPNELTLMLLPPILIPDAEKYPLRHFCVGVPKSKLESLLGAILPVTLTLP